MKHDHIYVGHILECIERIEHYTRDGHQTFLSTTLIQDGVIRNLQTIGQSVSRVSEALKQAHPEIDWRSIVGFRNVLVHDYLGINITRVWEVVEHDVPALKQHMLRILQHIQHP